MPICMNMKRVILIMFNRIIIETAHICHLMRKYQLIQMKRIQIRLEMKRLNEQLKVQQERRAALQQERAERLAKIEAEIASLQPYESDSQFGQQ